MAKAIHAINAALVEGGAEEVLAALKEPMLNIRSITDECAATYQSKLVEATEEKAKKGSKQFDFLPLLACATEQVLFD